MLKKALFLMIVGSLLVVALSFAQEKITITTYYPSPYGSYRELRAQRMAIGTNFYDAANYCWGADCGTNVINAGTDLIVEGRTGIGRDAFQVGAENRQVKIRVGPKKEISAIPILDVNDGTELGRGIVVFGNSAIGNHTPSMVLNKGNGTLLDTPGASDIYFSGNGGIAANAGLYFFTDVSDQNLKHAGFHFRKHGESIPGTGGKNELMVIREDGTVGIPASNSRYRLSVTNSSTADSADSVESAIYAYNYNKRETNMAIHALGRGSTTHAYLGYSRALAKNPINVGVYGATQSIAVNNYAALFSGKVSIAGNPRDSTPRRDGRLVIGGSGGATPVKYDKNRPAEATLDVIGQTADSGYAAAKDVWLKQPVGGGSGKWASQVKVSGPKSGSITGKNPIRYVSLGKNHAVCFLTSVYAGGCSGCTTHCQVYIAAADLAYSGKCLKGEWCLQVGPTGDQSSSTTCAAACID
jgi:hypothetical protein